ncbi:MAG: hydroxymethylbilane synthase [Actinomycetia bacterium]|nr:hydroxymethylbilane synthase [Actinomycetes bacterium]
MRIATRGSDLALWQARFVAERVESVRSDATAELVVVTTGGDRDQTSPISAIGGRGVFAKEVQAAVLDGRADIAVHSAKDLTSTPPGGLTIGSFPARADVRDVLIGAELRDLRPGATIATGSVRRRTQLAHARPDLNFVELRGNVPSRVAKAGVGGVAAVVLAAAGLQRLGMESDIAEYLDTDIVLPQVGQGALAIECRDDDTATLDVLNSIDDPAVRSLVEAERAWLRVLGSGCELPVGGLASWEGGEIQLQVVLCALDGSVALRGIATGRDPEAVGAEAAHEVLDLMGGHSLLESS